jgi:hypothetical protein
VASIAISEANSSHFAQTLSEDPSSDWRFGKLDCNYRIVIGYLAVGKRRLQALPISGRVPEERQ